MENFEKYSPDLDNSGEINEKDLEKLKELLSKQKQELFSSLLENFLKDENKENLEKLKKLLGIEISKNNDKNLKKFYDEIFGNKKEEKNDDLEKFKETEDYKKLSKEKKELLGKFFILSEKYGKNILKYLELINYDEIESVEKLIQKFDIIGKTKEEFEINEAKLINFFSGIYKKDFEYYGIGEFLFKEDKFLKGKNYIEEFLKLLEIDEKMKYSDLDEFLESNFSIDFYNGDFLKFLQENKKNIEIYDLINPKLKREYIYELVRNKFPIEKFDDFKQAKNIFTEEKIYALVVCFNNWLSIEQIKFYFSLFPNNKEFFKNFSNYYASNLNQIYEKVSSDLNKKWKFKDFLKNEKGEEKEMTFEEMLKNNYSLIDILYFLNFEEDKTDFDKKVSDYRKETGDLLKDFSDEDIDFWLLKNNISPENILIFKDLKKFTIEDLSFLGEDFNWEAPVEIKLENRKEILEKFLKINPNFTGADITYLQRNGLGFGEKFGYKNKLKISEKYLEKAMEKYVKYFENNISGLEIESFLENIGTDISPKMDEKFKKYKKLFSEAKPLEISLFYQIEKILGEKKFKEIFADFLEIKKFLENKEKLKGRFFINDDFFEKIQKNKIGNNYILIALANGKHKNIILESFIDFVKKGFSKEEIEKLILNNISSGDKLYFETNGLKFGKNFENLPSAKISYNSIYVAKINNLQNETLRIILNNYLGKTLITEEYSSDIDNQLSELFEFGENGKLESLVNFFEKNKNLELKIGNEKVKIYGNRQFLLGLLVYIYDIYGENSKNIDWKKILKEYEKSLNDYLKSGKNIEKIFTIGGNKYYGEDEIAFTGKTTNRVREIFEGKEVVDYSSGTTKNNEFENASEAISDLERYLEANEDEKVLFFLSGHGGSNGSFQMSKGGLGKSDFENLESLASRFSNLNIMMDSCYSGFKFDLKNMRGNIFINSGQNLSSSSTATGSDELSALVFNEKLGDFDESGEITAEELEIYMMINYKSSPIINNGFREFYKKKK